MNKMILAFLTLTVFAKEHILLDQNYHDFLNSAQKTWIAGNNKRWEKISEQELHTQTGAILNVPDHLKLPLKEIELLEDLPENFDSREAWPDCESIKEIRDQSTCGSCWAFGAAEVMSDRLCIASGQQLQTRISTEDLLTCCGFTCGFGCHGGLPAGAWHYFKQIGIVTGHNYNDTQYCRSYSFPPCDHHVDGKYEPCDSYKPTPMCSKECSKESGRIYKEDKIQASEVYSVPGNEKSIMSEIMKNGPVEATFSVYRDWWTYKSGVYQHVDDGSNAEGHCIKILGWGVENGVKYWLCANSYNEDWGEQGFFRILRGENHCGIESLINAGNIKL